MDGMVGSGKRVGEIRGRICTQYKMFMLCYAVYLFLFTILLCFLRVYISNAHAAHIFFFLAAHWRRPFFYSFWGGHGWCLGIGREDTIL